MANFQEIKNLSVGALNAFFLPSTDVSGFKWVSIHFNSSTLNGSVSFLGSNDGVNFVPINLFRADSLSNIGSTFVFNPVGQIWHGPLFFRYFAVQCQAYNSGSISGLLEFYESPGWYWQNVLAAGSSIIGAVSSKIEQLIENGQGFTATTGVLATATNANVYIALGLLASNIAKNIYIYRISAGAQNPSGDIHISQAASLDANLTAAITPLNNNLGSATTSLATIKSTANANTAPTSTTGTTRDQQGSAANLGYDIEFIQQNNEGIFIPANSTQGITVWIKIPTAANTAQATFKWVEF